MSENGMNGHRPSTGIEWKVGFMNCAMKYMTAETFGFKVNNSGTALKKKQIWCIEQDPTNNSVYIRSHLGRYMTSDKYGNVTVEAEEKGADEQFVVEYSPDGKWAFKHVTHGNYLSGTDAEVKCFEKSPTDKNWWSIQLYVHPQVNLRNSNRKRYARLNGDTNQLECTEITPWGADALVILDFVEGKYALKSCDGRCLSREGTLEASVNADTLFTMEIHSGCLAFKDSEGRYLTAVGQGTMKCRNKTISKDELFTIEDSHPQVQIVSHNGKCVSIKQGLDVTANQLIDDVGDTELFQLEYQGDEKWALKAHTNKYWALQTTATVQANISEVQSQCIFTIEYQDDGTVGIKGNDGKYLTNKQTGILFSSGSSCDEAHKFKMNIVNRPLLVLKSEFGFVGIKGSQYICNKAKYDSLAVSSTGHGTYNIKGPDGKYVGIGDDTMVCSEDGPTAFQFVFCGKSVMAIKAPNGSFLKGEQNGLFKANASEICPPSTWEY